MPAHEPPHTAVRAPGPGCRLRRSRPSRGSDGGVCWGDVTSSWQNSPPSIPGETPCFTQAGLGGFVKGPCRPHYLCRPDFQARPQTHTNQWLHQVHLPDSEAGDMLSEESSILTASREFPMYTRPVLSACTASKVRTTATTRFSRPQTATLYGVLNAHRPIPHPGRALCGGGGGAPAHGVAVGGRRVAAGGQGHAQGGREVRQHGLRARRPGARPRRHGWRGAWGGAESQLSQSNITARLGGSD
jgi:hypothetical protein